MEALLALFGTASFLWLVWLAIRPGRTRGNE